MNKTYSGSKNALWYLAKVVRILTVPPLMAVSVFSVLLTVDGFYSSLWEYGAAVLFIGLLPTLAYPLSEVIPRFKAGGRDGQRTLAFIMSALGYVFGVAFALLYGVAEGPFLIFVTYFLSGMTLLLVNKLLRFKASGHACGSMGPVALLVCFCGPWALIPGGAIFALSLWGSLYMKRHTSAQFIVGAAIPVFYLLILSLFKLV